MPNLIDVTFLELTDAVMDVVAAVKGGAACVDVEHLTPAEQDAACKLLGLSGATWRATDAMKAAAACPRSAVSGGSFDFEAAILDQQDARDGDYL